MEFLLVNHPLDCPICDQGGECDLQVSIVRELYLDYDLMAVIMGCYGTECIVQALFRPQLEHLGHFERTSLKSPLHCLPVVGSSLGRARGVETLGKFLTPVCLCSPSSTSWYRSKGGDALRLGSKGRYGLCVGGR